MRPPVFIVGNARSGTTLLYHMLLSSGGFAIYRAETHVFNLLCPFFGNLQSKSNREKLLSYWVNSVLFKLSELDVGSWKKNALIDCSSYGAFLTYFMESIANQQNVDRWAECTPLHLHHMEQIKKEIPDAQFIHIIRDGRDVAVSMKKLGWSKPLPLNLGDELYTASLRWAWGVNKGRKAGAALGNDYIEVYFEDLIFKPQDVLNALGIFLEHELNYETIFKNGIGSVKKPNTAFKEENEITPNNRWKKILKASEIIKIEELIGYDLRQYGYSLLNSNLYKSSGMKVNLLRILCKLSWNIKQQIKFHLPFLALGETPQQFDDKMKIIFKNIQ